MAGEVKKKVFTGFTKKTAIADVPALSQLKYYDPSGNVLRAEIELLMQRMKGYKEYTFAIRQSSTDAPILYLIKDDFGVTALTATYNSAGNYTIDLTTLGFTGHSYETAGEWNLLYTQRAVTSPIGSHLYVQYLATEGEINIVTSSDSAYANGILDAATGYIISIRQTLS